ncbi:MAG: sugar MFS transporter [Chitinophagaceae bacterium]|nr:sugar MFS transporter [Chitinophagaceae bacterium]
MAKSLQPVTASSLSKQQTFISLLIIAVLFFIFGFVSWANAILIPYFKIACELNHSQSYLVTFAFYIAYLVMSVPSSYLLKAIGFKKGIMAGFWVMAVGALVFIPAAYMRTYGIFLTGLFTIGCGLAILQTAANPYVTILGPKEHAAQRISFMGICNKGAGILAPLVLGAVILKVTDSGLTEQLATMTEAEKNTALNEFIRRVITPYGVMGVILILLGLAVRFSPLPEITTDEEAKEQLEHKDGKTSIFQFPHLILGAVAIFLHVGTQVIAIDTIIPYALSMNISLYEAKVFPSYTLTATIVGYIAGIVLIPRYIRQGTVLKICTILGIIFSSLILLTSGSVTILGHTADTSIWFVVLLGLANSLVWAGIWPLALDGLGRFTKLGASVMIMGLCGNAILPMLYGYFADSPDFTLKTAYWVLLPCYAYLLFYAFKGYRLRSWS